LASLSAISPVLSVEPSSTMIISYFEAILGKILALVFAYIDSHEIPREDYINFLSKLSTQV